MNYINIIEKSDCYGCNSCVQACSIGCIEMKTDEKGFWYPHVDTNNCIQCKKCINVCQMNDKEYKNSMKLDNINVYAVKHKDDAIRYESSSGGMFTALSDYIISQGGIIFGALFDDEFRVLQKSASNIEERNKMRGSKYVQSYVGNSYKETEFFLRQGKLILYTGTPCQIAGLYKYLGVEYNNLLTCDLICYGTPSPRVFKRYIEYIEIKSKDKVKMINFRHKKNGWYNYTLEVDFQQNKYSNLLNCDPYGKLFLDNIILRPSCYKCKYANTSRLGDITIGDYWGIKNSIPNFPDDKGVSLVFVNTKKGQLLFDNIRESIDVEDSKLEDCVPYNNLNGPARLSYQEEFWNDYIKGEEFSYILAKYAIENIIANRLLLDKAIYYYVINTGQNDINNSFDSIINMLCMWKYWCDKTFIEMPLKYSTQITKYKKNQEEAFSYGAFTIVAYNANKKYV